MTGGAGKFHIAEGEAIAAGRTTDVYIEEVLALLPASGGPALRALPEGSLFQAGEPVLAIEGRYDFSLDIVEIDGRPIAKRGKESGRKALVVCGSCGGRTVVPAVRAPGGLACPRCGAPAVDALQPPLA